MSLFTKGSWEKQKRGFLSPNLTDGTQTIIGDLVTQIFNQSEDSIAKQQNYFKMFFKSLG